MTRMTVLAVLVLACLAPGATGKAPAALDKEVRELFKDQIRDSYPPNVKAFAIARAKVTAAKTAAYCPGRTSRCGLNPTCGHPKRKTTTLDLAIGKVLFRTGSAALPKRFKNTSYFGKTAVKTGGDVYVSLYVYQRSGCRISRIRPAPPGPAGPAKPAGGRAINLAVGDSGKTVKAAVGDLVLITLRANPSTGYAWSAADQPGGSAVMLKSKRFLTASQMNPEIRPMPGQGGATTFTYHVVQAGKATISLAYRRPWEKKAKPARTFTAAIVASVQTGPTVTGKIAFSRKPDVGKISRIVVSIRNTALADGPAPLIGTVELKGPFTLPVTFAVPYDPKKVRPNPMFYSISARVYTVVGGREKLYYINDTRHSIFRTADDTRRDIAVKKLR